MAIVMAAIMTAGCALPTGPRGLQGPAGLDGAVPIVVVSDLYPARALAFSATTLVSVGDGAQIRVSADAKSWAAPSSMPDISADLLSVAYGNGVFVAVGSGGTIVRSTAPGEIWLNAESGPGANDNLTSVAYNNGVFVAVGAFIFTSTDGGVTWVNNTPVESGPFSNVSVANGRFFTGTDAGELYSSVDGASWSEAITLLTDLGGNFSAIVGVAYGNGAYLAVDISGNMASSDDGATWEDMTSLVSTGDSQVVDFSFGMDRFPVLVSGWPSEILWPYDELVWLYPVTSLPGSAYTSIQWVPWLRGGVYIVTQNAMLAV